MRPSSPSAAALTGDLAWVRRLAERLVRHTPDADDVAQDTFVARLTHAPAPGVPERAWLGRVARNLVVNRLVREARRRRWESVADPRNCGSPEEALAREQAARALGGLIMALPLPQRDVVLLRYYNELESPEIAARLGLAPGTVRWRLKEALDTLRRELATQGEHASWMGALPLRSWPLLGKLASAAICVALATGFAVRAGTSAAASHPRTATTAEVRSAAVVERAAPLVAEARATSPAPLAADTRGHASDTSMDDEVARLEAESKQMIAQQQLMTEIVGLEDEIEACNVRHGGPPKQHALFGLEVRVVDDHGIGRAVQADIVPSEGIEADFLNHVRAALPDSVPSLEACTLDIVRAHEFSSPGAEDFSGTLNMELAAPPPRRYTAGSTEYDAYMAVLGPMVTDVIGECGAIAGDLVPTDGGIAHFELDADGNITAATLRPRSGEQSFPGLEECLSTPEMIGRLDVTSTSLDVPFSAPAQPSTFSIDDGVVFASQ